MLDERGCAFRMVDREAQNDERTADQALGGACRLDGRIQQSAMASHQAETVRRQRFLAREMIVEAALATSACERCRRCSRRQPSATRTDAGQPRAAQRAYGLCGGLISHPDLRAVSVFKKGLRGFARSVSRGRTAISFLLNQQWPSPRAGAPFADDRLVQLKIHRV